MGHPRGPFLAAVLSLFVLAATTGCSVTPDWIAALQVPRPSETPDLPDLTRTPKGRKVLTAWQWDAQRTRIHQQWQHFLGHLPEPRCPLDPQVVEKEYVSGRPPRCSLDAQFANADGTVGGLRRSLVRLQVEPGEWMECYVFWPSTKRPLPAVVVLHSTTDETIDQPAGLGKDPSKAFALDLARRGYVTIAPRNFLWGYRGTTSIRDATRVFLDRYPGVTGMAKMIHDASCCVDYLYTLPQVRKDAIGAIGHSLGGKEVTFLMAFDERVVCGVSSEGGVGFDFSNYHDPWYLGETIRGENADRKANEVVSLIAPRAWLLIGGNSADGDKSWPYVESVLPIYRRLGAADAVGLFVHPHGHSMPESARDVAFRWLDYHLKPHK